jgi:hypothetical protein
MIAIDKFCMSRWCRLPLSWSRQPHRLRNTATTGAEYPSSGINHDTEEEPYADQTQAVDHSSACDPPAQRLASLGSSLPTPAELDNHTPAAG